jgi:hypothetical protein
MRPRTLDGRFPRSEFGDLEHQARRDLGHLGSMPVLDRIHVDCVGVDLRLEITDSRRVQHQLMPILLLLAQ